jgi:excisionase family DNA binding protein
MKKLDPLLSAQELADYLEVPLATLYAWRYRGEGPQGFRAGKHLRYRKSDIDRWINDRLPEGAR